MCGRAPTVPGLYFVMFSLYKLFRPLLWECYGTLDGQPLYGENLIDLDRCIVLAGDPGGAHNFWNMLFLVLTFSRCISVSIY